MKPLTDLELRGILERFEGRIIDLEALNVPSFNQDTGPIKEQPKVEVERIHRYINVYPTKKKDTSYIYSSIKEEESDDIGEPD